MRCTSTSVSLSDEKMLPSASSSARSSSPLVRLPLWATAMEPCAQSTAMGCAFLMWLPPAVL